MGPTISPRSCGWPGEPWPGGNPSWSSSSSLWMAPSCLAVLGKSLLLGKKGNGAGNTSPWVWRGCRGQDSTWCSSRGTSLWPEGMKGTRRSPVRDGAPRGAVLGAGRERGPPAGAGEGFCGIFTPSLWRSPLCPPGRRQGSRSASGDVAAPACTAGESCGRRIKAQRWRSGTNSAASLSKGHTISTRKLYTSGPNEVRVGVRQGTRSGLASASHSHQGELAKVFLYCTPSPAAWQPLTQSFLEPEAACLCFWFL